MEERRQSGYIVARLCSRADLDVGFREFTHQQAFNSMQNSGLPGVVPKSSPYSAVVMTEQLVIQHLKQCRDLTRGFAYRVFPNFWRQWCKQILELAEQAKSNKDQIILYEAQHLLTAIQQAAEQEFCQHLTNGYVKFKNKALNTLTGEERFSGDILSLVEHSDLEETIAVTSITHRADNFFAEPLWGLQQRLALLNEGQKISEPSNPASPVQFCEALRKVLTSIEIDVKTKLVAYKIFDQEVIGQLDSLYAELNDYLIRQNLLPNLRFAPVSDQTRKDEEKLDDDPFERTDIITAGAPSTNNTETTHISSGMNVHTSDIQYQNSLLQAIRLLQSHMPPLPAVGAAQALGAPPLNPADLLVFSQGQLVSVLDELQNLSLMKTQSTLSKGGSGQESLAPQPVVDISRQMMQQILVENEKGAIGSSDMEIIDVVGMLFEYMLSDEQLPDSIKALLSYLHTPFLKIAFIDKGFFEQLDHPARLLLNSLAEAGVRWVSNDGSDQYDIYSRIKATVFRLLKEFKNDVRIFAECLIEFNSYSHNLARRQELMERRALEKAQGEEKLREAKIQVNTEVRHRTDGREMPSVILLLLLQPWSDFLSFVLLRYGEKSESWIRALSIVDDLLWTLEPKTSQSDKTRQLEVQDQVINALEHGFQTIGYDQAKGNKLLEAVTSLQRMALMSRKGDPAPAPMRNKLESMAVEKTGLVAGNIQALTPKEAKVADHLKLLEFGTWFEFDGGKRLKVVWYNKKTQHYMLVDQQGRKVSLAAGAQLARDLVTGKVKIIEGSSKPFFERALENIYQSLNERVDTLKAGKS